MKSLKHVAFKDDLGVFIINKWSRMDDQAGPFACP